MTVDNKILKGVNALISAYGKLTCGVLADKLQVLPSSMIYFLRDAVDAGVLTECNGFYDIPRPRQNARPERADKPCQEPEPVNWCDFRKSLPWIEGNSIPSLVKDFAMGILTCETTYVVIEVSEELCKEGVSQFTFGYIDARLGRFIDGMSGWEITRHVLRYLIIDRSPAPEYIPVSVEVA
ncbi:hypothetical protein A4181_002498 [Salmonella enterica subsp. houtenae serovar 44:z4,z23:-]|uniref:Gp11 C-terminal domain-containing protein n=1 Tax=Salmonella enterica subsp. enterica serovar Gaminara TaxID=913070 RepID=A0A602MNP3_SALET|nr:hypothetical protein [Salmonella enterica]EBY7362852.1 hypothetical protein [Salmonella enterica subsp. enterica serovar Tennessee]ECG1246037.1 hypothetical protein [Salmonella enterica subsp. houtenae]ECS4567388.1 hypothetical protein [Salmonella enterica subsp. enterica serovar Gaminara]EDO4165865.1 hypothetical protein [Salmonella enterica subsp. enterica serovar Braenderup]EDT9423827.1 hypothetical protein [Salmonella enterica subsp. houtenae serovar 44:z4,z23:-]EIS5044537.1 hypothetic